MLCSRVRVIGRSSVAACFVGLAVIFAISLLAGHALCASAGGPLQPSNTVVLIADDYGWHDVGYHGSDIHTPNLDKLAAAGVRLERHYVYPTCSPTRAGLFTGCNPSRFGILSPIDGRSEQALPKQAANLATILKSRGYATALAGKWHLGLRPEVGPRQYGFDQTYGYLHGQIDQYTHHYKNGDRSWHRNDVFLDEEGHATDLIANEAIRVIGEKREAPLFLWVAFSVPHHPVQEEEKWIAAYRDSIQDPSRRLYAACVSHMDAAIGRIVEALRQAGQLDNTLILFTGDNGGQKSYASKTEYEGNHGPYPTLGDNRPWHGWKGDLYEGGIRVPAFVYWHGRLRPRVLQQTISYLDWFPTFAHLAGAQVAPEWKVEGRNVWPLLTGEKETPPAKPLYWETPRAKAVLEGDWKLIVSKGKTAGVELYNLAADPAEEHNQAEKNPGKVEELRRLLAAQTPPDAH